MTACCCCWQTRQYYERSAHIGRLLRLLLQDEQDKQCIDGGLLRQLQLLRSARLLRLALICQDLADSMTAINDITGGGGPGGWLCGLLQLACMSAGMHNAEGLH